MIPTFSNLIHSTVRSCKAFSKCSTSFFDLERRPNNWTGWENWLTVDIVRGLNDTRVLPFYAYPKSSQKLDIFIEGPKQLAVEIKVTYLTDHEACMVNRKLRGGVANDAEKLKQLPHDIERVLLLSACFESKRGLMQYPKSISNDLSTNYSNFSYRLYNCSHGGHNLLLVLSTLRRFPRLHRSDE